MLVYYKAIIIIESRLNICLRYRKTVKFFKDLIKYVNICKILVVLTSCLFSKLK